MCATHPVVWVKMRKSRIRGWAEVVVAIAAYVSEGAVSALDFSHLL
jgi:hypothetical protein